MVLDAVRKMPSAITGKMSTDSSPAHTSAAAVIGVIIPAATPIWLAVTMNGRDVACSSPDAAERVLPRWRIDSSAGTPRTTRASRNHGTRSSADGLASKPDRSSRTPLLMKNTGIRNP